MRKQAKRISRASLFATSTRSREGRSLHFETLEQRRLLAITVDTSLDAINAQDDVTSLREAIVQANNTPGADEIDFSITGAINLTEGELEITDTLTINGPGQALLTIDSQHNSRVLNFSASTGDLSLEGLTLQNGRTVGDNVGSSDNTHSGGGIRFVSNGDLTISSSTLRANSTEGSDADGGGIYSIASRTTLSGTTLTENTSAENGGGITTFNSTLTLFNCNLYENHSIKFGGAIMAYSSSSVALIDSNLNLNSARYGGGISCSSFVELTLSNSTLNGNNSLIDGGGIYTLGLHLTISDSTISNNSTTRVGGGVFSNFSAITITNSTISNNTGGGIYSSIGDAVTLTNSTITRNHGRRSGGIFVTTEDSLTIKNSIIAGNTVDDGGLGPDLIAGANSLTVEASLIGNTSPNSALVLDAISNGENNIVDTDPLLGPLAANGGLTQTHALLPGSPALNEGFTTAIFDQRGAPFNRIDLNGPDIGAYEAQKLPSADFDEDEDVDGADFLAWQRGYGTENATRLNGNSDDDTDTDASDLAAWLVSFGQPQIQELTIEDGNTQPIATTLAAPTVVTPSSLTALLHTAIAWELASEALAHEREDGKPELFSSTSLLANEATDRAIATLDIVPTFQFVAKSLSTATDSIGENEERQAFAEEFLAAMFD